MEQADDGLEAHWTVIQNDLSLLFICDILLQQQKLIDACFLHRSSNNYIFH